MTDFGLIVLGIAILIAAIIFGPLITIWAINVLAEAGGAEFAIPYTIDTWFAMLLIGGAFAGSSRSSKK